MPKPILVLDVQHKRIKYFYNGRSWTIEELINELEYTREQLESCVGYFNTLDSLSNKR